MRAPTSPVFMFIYLAVGSASLGFGLVLALLAVAGYLRIDISRNLWLVAIPAVLTLAINITAIELYQKFMKGRRK